MSQKSIENILSSPDKQTEYNIINTVSTDINKGYDSLRNTILGGGNKNIQTTKKTIINQKQITIDGEKREKNRSEKRKI